MVGSPQSACGLVLDADAASFGEGAQLEESAQRCGGSSWPVGLAEDQRVVLDGNILQVRDGHATLLAGQARSKFEHGLGSSDVSGLRRVGKLLASRSAPLERPFPPDVTVFSGHQPGYFRSLSFFAKMATSDVFCFADDMQFVRGEWHNRQRFPRVGEQRSAAGSTWLTVPLVSAQGFQSIGEKRIAADGARQDWRLTHLRTIEAAYSRAPYFDRYAPFLQSLFGAEWQSLAALCEATTRFVALELGIATPCVLSSSQVGFVRGLAKGERVAAEIDVLRDELPCRRRATYLCGAGASYLNARRVSGLRERDFIERRGIEIQACTVDPAIIQTVTGLLPQAPAIALLFELGPSAGPLMRKATRCNVLACC